MATEYAVWTWRKTLPSNSSAISRAIECVLERLGRAGWASHDLFGIHLALEEALVNAVEHGNRNEPGKWIQLLCVLFPEKLTVEIQDEGAGFEPRRVVDPRDAAQLELPHGRGLLLMKSFMTRVEYVGHGNCVVLEKERTMSAAVA